MIAKVHGRWAFVSRHTHRPLAYWHGAGRPTKEWEAEQERRVQYFKHLGESEPWDDARENPVTDAAADRIRKILTWAEPAYRAHFDVLMHATRPVWQLREIEGPTESSDETLVTWSDGTSGTILLRAAPVGTYVYVSLFYTTPSGAGPMHEAYVPKDKLGAPPYVIGALRPPFPPGRAVENPLAREPAEDWRDLVTDAEYVPAAVLPEMPSVVERALAAGARPPLEYVGAGMTSVVFCTGDVAFKVGRRATPTLRRMLGEEAEWLEAAGRVPGVREHVAQFYGYNPEEVVITRACPKRDPDMSAYRYGESKLWDLHHKTIAPLMLPHGWALRSSSRTATSLRPRVRSSWTLRCRPASATCCSST